MKATRTRYDDLKLSIANAHQKWNGFIFNSQNYIFTKKDLAIFAAEYGLPYRTHVIKDIFPNKNIVKFVELGENGKPKYSFVCKSIPIDFFENVIVGCSEYQKEYREHNKKSEINLFNVESWETKSEEKKQDTTIKGINFNGISDAELVNELRSRGYEVTAKKIVEL